MRLKQVITESGKTYDVIGITKDNKIIVESEKGMPFILSEKVKYLIYETVMEVLKNLIKKLFKIN